MIGEREGEGAVEGAARDVDVVGSRVDHTGLGLPGLAALHHLWVIAARGARTTVVVRVLLELAETPLDVGDVAAATPSTMARSLRAFADELEALDFRVRRSRRGVWGEADGAEVAARAGPRGMTVAWRMAAGTVLSPRAVERVLERGVAHDLREEAPQDAGSRVEHDVEALLEALRPPRPLS